MLRSVLDFGAVADDLLPTGHVNPNATDNRQPFQAAIDDVSMSGGSLVVPSGRFRVAGAGVLLAIRKRMELVFEPGGVIVVDADAQTDVLLVEGAGSDAMRTVLRGVEIRPRGSQYDRGRHGIIVRAPFVRLVDNWLVADVAGWGVVVESGTSGTPGLLGETLEPQGSYHNANGVVVRDGLVAECGEVSGPNAFSGDAARGGGINVHGSDANAVTVQDVFAEGCNVCFRDGSLEGVTWLRCYVEVGGPTKAVGFMDDSAAGALYVRCREEIAVPSKPGLHTKSIGSSTLFRNTRASSVDDDLRTIAQPLRNTHDRWSYRQRVHLVPGAQVVKLSYDGNPPIWAYSASIARGDTRSSSSSNVVVQAQLELPTLNDWSVGLPAQVADQQIAARSAALLACDVVAGPVVRGYQDAAGGLFCVRVENRTQAPVDLDVVWSMEVFERSQPDTQGP